MFGGIAFVNITGYSKAKNMSHFSIMFVHLEQFIHVTYLTRYIFYYHKCIHVQMIYSQGLGVIGSNN